MLTKKAIEKAGYTVLPKGGWFRIDPYIIPQDWHDVCKSFGIDPSCKSAILCIAGVKEENNDGTNE
jgi:hypothetical protein